MVDRKRYGKRWDTQRKRILQRDSYTCGWCGIDLNTPGVVASVDHVIPVEKGGSHDDDNLVASCRQPIV